ncbi:hypothetical protein AMTRI_Chr12g236770 [Amborella trichopoda]
MVKNVWKEKITGSPMFRIAKKLQMLKKKLKVWNKNIFGNELQDVVGTNSMIDEDELIAKTKVHNALAIQEKFWASKSRVRWLQLGDRNTKYFHSMKGCSMNNDLCNLIPNAVDLVDNNFLEAVPSPSEIKDTHYWDIVKYDVYRAGYNNNFIMLFPKEQGVDTLSKFQPIYMGNFIFKIIPKILANRLRVIAQKLISEEQDVFLKGRRISSNICMASKLLNYFPKKLHAYNSLEWPFLLEVLKRFGFTVKFVSWVKQILHSANISVERGLRQEDKMICTLNGPRGVGSKTKIFQIIVILWVNSSIQTICYQKIVGSFYCLPLKYLGVPIFLGAPKARLLRPLLERIRDKLSGWKGKILISWDKVCKPINEGCLGLRRLRDVNFIFAKYFKEDAFMRSTPQISSMRHGLVKDIWVENTSLASQSRLPLSVFKNSKARVSHFISSNPQAWCFPMVHSTILNEFLSVASGIDFPTLLYRIKEIGNILSLFSRDKGCNSYWNSLVWYKGIHPRVSLMSWKLANNAIAIDEKIMYIGIPLVSCCSLCGNSMETRDHLFVTCTFANSMWSWSGFGGILRDSSRVVLGSFSGPIPMGTNYLAELDAFIYGVEYVIRKCFTNAWIEFLITDGYVVGDNI